MRADFNETLTPTPGWKKVKPADGTIGRAGDLFVILAALLIFSSRVFTTNHYQGTPPGRSLQASDSSGEKYFTKAP
jgi:hypothetical protein